MENEMRIAVLLVVSCSKCPFTKHSYEYRNTEHRGRATSTYFCKRLQKRLEHKLHETVDPDCPLKKVIDTINVDELIKLQKQRQQNKEINEL